MYKMGMWQRMQLRAAGRGVRVWVRQRTWA